MPQNSSLFNGGIIGKDNTPSASDKVTTITSNGCFNRTTATATVIVVAGGGSDEVPRASPEVRDGCFFPIFGVSREGPEL